MAPNEEKHHTTPSSIYLHIIDVYLVPEWEGGEGGEVLGPPHRHEEEPGRRLVYSLLTRNNITTLYKRLVVFPSSAGISLTKLSLGGEGKTADLFLQ